VLEVERKYGQRSRSAIAISAASMYPSPRSANDAVNRDRAAQQRRRQIHDGMFAVSHRLEKRPGSVTADPGAQQLIDLHDHRLGDEQVPPELGHENRGEGIGLVPAVGRGDKRARVRDDPQRASTSSFRYRSAARPRFSGPSPAPT
jgi:hypothetical protein